MYGRPTMVSQVIVEKSHPEAVYRRTVEALARLSVLPENWDTYGSRPVTNLAVEGVLRILGLAVARGLRLPVLGPVPGGGIQLEWYAGERS